MKASLALASITDTSGADTLSETMALLMPSNIDLAAVEPHLAAGVGGRELSMTGKSRFIERPTR